jgi:1,4-alpha-glucan branching enzyme
VLPSPSLKGNTTFKLKGYPDASIVTVAGSFNNWNQSQYIFGREGDVWICRVDLEPGKHAYKFIVDGNWLLDPDNPNTEDDDYGVKNSVIIVAKLSGRTADPDRQWTGRDYAAAGWSCFRVYSFLFRVS